MNFPGTTEEAFTFYKSVFGGELIALLRYKDTPEAGRVPAGDKDKIMHVSLQIGKGNMVMGADALESMGRKLVVGNNFYVLIEPETKEEAKEFFDGLSVGGKIELTLQDTYWGAYFGMLSDKFGIRWMVNYTNPKQA